MKTIKQQIKYVEDVIRDYEQDIKYNQYISIVETANKKIDFYKSILSSLEELYLLSELNKFKNEMKEKGIKL